MFQDDGYEALAPACRAALAGERTEFEYTVPNDSRFFWVTALPLRDEQGSSVWGGLALTQDITDLRRTEHELAAQTVRAHQDELTGSGQPRALQ